MAWSQQLDLDDARLSRHVDGVSDSLFLIYGGICVSLVVMAGLMSGVSFLLIAIPCAPGSLVDDDRSMMLPCLLCFPAITHALFTGMSACGLQLTLGLLSISTTDLEVGIP